MKAWFVSGRKYRKLQEGASQLWRELQAARVEMTDLEYDAHVEGYRVELSLAHRIRIHRDELKFQPMADAKGQHFTWVCTGERIRVAYGPDEVQEEPTVHQHSVKPRTTTTSPERDS